MKKRFFPILALFIAIATTGCKPYIANNTEHYDKITKTLTLNKNFEGKNFLYDGIGRASLAAYTDGDTARFTLATNESIVIRLHSIDTPESTSNIEKWGKAASHFFEETISKATEIVLEATADVAKHDSFGTRYLGYVWYKTAEYSKFKNLNLEMVENGYSENTGNATEEFRYNKYFEKANEFAASIKLRVWSLLDDPDYDPRPTTITIKEFLADPYQYYNAEKDIGRKVLLDAYLSDLDISESGTYNFVACEYNQEDNKIYSIDVFAGYTSKSASNMKVGHKYHLVGNIARHAGNWQLSNIDYMQYFTTGDDTTYVTQRNYYGIFNSNTKYSANFSACIYTDVTVVSSTIENNKLTVVGTTQAIGSKGPKDEVLTYTFTCDVDASFSNFAVGSKFSTKGFQLVEKSGEYYIRSTSDIIRK